MYDVVTICLKFAHVKRRGKYEKNITNRRANISFTPVHECNFSCRYCFAKGGNTYNDIEKDFTDEKIEKCLNFFS